MSSKNHNFNAEISKVLDIMINSLYTDKDVFLRELISNASDACEKLRYNALSDQALLENDTEFKVVVEINRDEKAIIIRDNGIGMNEFDMIENLGTIAKSGTGEFIKSLEKENSKDKISDMIGQFGVGFYSSFMVAKEVEVISKKAGEEGVYLWKSDGKSNYEIEKIEKEISHGTEIKLFLKDEFCESYLDKFKIQNIIKSYSNHINIPVFLKHEDGLDATEINKKSALWTLDKKNVTQEEYNDFFKSLSHLAGEPFLTLHNKIEGNVSYSNLLFIPSSKPFDLFHPDRQTRVKLYVKRVFISEDSALDMIPKYLRFVYGIIDSPDLPLNISRQTLQDSEMLGKIRELITKKILSELRNKKDKDFNEYVKFWENFGPVLKEGLCEMSIDREALLDLILIKTTKSDNKYTSMKDYLDRMKGDQKDIYYYISESDDFTSNTQLEGFLKNDLEVILLSDHVDNFWTTVIYDYKGIDLKSINRSDIDLSHLDKKDEDGDIKHDKKDDDDIEGVLNGALLSIVKRVVVSKKLTNSAASLSIDGGGMDIKMEKFLISQGQIKSSSLKTLEINPSNKLVKKAYNLLKSESESDKNKGKELAMAIFDIACIAQDETLKTPNITARRLFEILQENG